MRTAAGSVRLQNCAFWGPAVQNVVSHGKGYLSLANCYFSSGRPKTSAKTDAAGNPKTVKEKALVEADAGKLQIQGCTFDTPEPSIRLGKGLRHAIVSGNNGIRGVTIDNEIGGRAILSGNEPGPER